MILDDILSKDNKKKEIVKKNNIIWEDDEDVETYMYDVRKPMAFLNEGNNGVFEVSKQTGINTDKSVFDKGIVFKTGI
ncbi:MAG: hypothetical protein K6F54_03695 [Lachnospiraceae bacterium]|jgi:hypothetical protein|nr:hypothetical protein [Lachnospiraceae bacterium]